MNAKDIQNSEWYIELVEEVQEGLTGLLQELASQAPALRLERENLEKQIQGWKMSLGDSALADNVRRDIQDDYNRSLQRIQQIDDCLTDEDNRRRYHETLLDAGSAAERLTRLQQALDGNNVTEMNVQLMLHVDKIECLPDRSVVLRTCRLGALPQVADLLKKDDADSVGQVAETANAATERGVPRRRAKRNVETFGNGDLAQDAQRALDPHRFVGLDDGWFWHDSLEIPQVTPWCEDHAEEVFRRRQQGRLSFAKLAEEFGVSTPTACAAVKRYLEGHPDEVDQVNLPRGGKRPPKFDLSLFGNEARNLWENGWSKRRLAERFGCSPPTIDKALEWAYAQDGLPLPASQDHLNARIAQARAMLDDDCPLNEIAEQLEVSDVTARDYLKASFRAESKPMPDLRSRGKHA